MIISVSDICIPVVHDTRVFATTMRYLWYDKDLRNIVRG